MRTSNKMVELVGKFEGERLTSYKCPAGVWTIGFGTTKINGRPVTQGMTITHEQAINYLKADLRGAENVVNALSVKLNQNQFDALVSFIYNCGSGNFKVSTMRNKILRDPNDASIKNEFIKWNKATVKGVKTELPGLTRRRAAEAAWYVYGEESLSMGDLVVWARS